MAKLKIIEVAHFFKHFIYQYSSHPQVSSMNYKTVYSSNKKLAADIITSLLHTKIYETLRGLDGRGHF